MSKIASIKAVIRETANRGQVKALRRDGQIPAVLYGAKQAPVSLRVPAREIQILLGHAEGENILVDVELDRVGKTETIKALIQEVQHHPVTADILHIDLLEVSMDETITANIPVEPTGEPIGVKNYGGLLEQGLRSLEVECLPADLPGVIHVNVSGLGIGETITVGRVPLPPGVVVLDNPDITVFHVLAPRLDTGASAESEAPSAPEVIREKKQEGAAGE